MKKIAMINLNTNNQVRNFARVTNDETNFLKITVAFMQNIEIMERFPEIKVVDRKLQLNKDEKSAYLIHNLYTLNDKKEKCLHSCFTTKLVYEKSYEKAYLN